MTSDKSEPSSTTSNTIMDKHVNQTIDDNCNDGDEKHVNESKTKESTLSKQNRQVHYRQIILSEYFSKQVVEKTSGQESNSDDSVMVDFRKLISQLLNAKVIIERLSKAAAKAKLCPKLRINLERLRLDQLKLKGEIKYAPRYCHKCKTMYIVDRNLSRQIKCNGCRTDLLYVCNKCNENFYVRYNVMRRHSTKCNGLKQSTGQKKSITLRYCADCNFFTTHYNAMRRHVVMMKHNVRDNEMVEGL